MKTNRWLLPSISVFILVASVVAAATLHTSAGTRTTLVQAGAGVSLAVLTLGYLLASNQQACAAAKAVAESQQMRIDSVRPVVCLRYLWHDLENGKPGPKTKRSTRLVNVGCGPALGIHLRWNLGAHATPEGSELDLLPYLVDCPLDTIAFGAPLGPDNGNPDMQIAFFESVYAENCISPIEHSGVRIEITYQDVFGNLYSTHLVRCAQTFHIAPRDCKELIARFPHRGDQGLEGRVLMMPKRTEEQEVATPCPQTKGQSQPPQPSIVNLVSVIADRMDPLLKLLEAWLGHSKDKEKTTEAHQRAMTVIVAVLVLVIVVSAGLLTYLDKVDGSTFTFLLGLVVGYVLTFVREAVFPRKGSE
jgi:hypothetical protein